MEIHPPNRECRLGAPPQEKQQQQQLAIVAGGYHRFYPLGRSKEQRKMASPEYWLLTVPNRGDAVEVTLNKMARGTAQQRAEAPQNPHRVDVPNLVVGTLDSLMALRWVG